MKNVAPTREYAGEVMRRADVLGAISEEEGCLVRRFGTPAMVEVNRVVGGWMREAGMEVRWDNVGNVIGRYGAAGKAKTFVLGSHLDTVRDAGKYDGPLGVLVAIACVQALHDAGMQLPFAIEVAAFADEEGLRYGTSYLGSRVFAGSFPGEYLELTDVDGISLTNAIRAFGCDPSALDRDKRNRDDLLGYCEVHIEQGPVLEREGLPVGVVSGIAGQARFHVIFTGESGHAGTVPMSMRRDALSAAAEFVLAVEALGQREEGLVATVGQLDVQPGASNVIPGRVTLSLDVRHSDNQIRRTAYRQLRAEAMAIADRRGIGLEWDLLQDNDSMHCSPGLIEKLGRAAEAAGYPIRMLSSGAGHDTVIMSEICPVAMLFVRCQGGISHNPTESVDAEDVAVAIEVMGRFLEGLDAAV